MIKLLAPAKINLSLEILGKRNDSYHEVDMVMQTINLFDEVCIEKSSKLGIEVVINKNIGCSNDENIAFKAAKKFFNYVDMEVPGLKISINKNIPICAGLAGGSSDGAAVIVGLNKMFNNKLTKSEMLKIAAQVGADVPFCILGGTARAKGIGTDLTVLKPLLGYYIVLVKPNISVSTKSAYEEVDRVNFHSIKKTENLVCAIQNMDINNVFNEMFNNFEQVNEMTEIKRIKETLINKGANIACMSGSGPSVFGIYSDKNLAISCFDYFVDNHEEVFFCEPIDYGVNIK